MNIEEINHLIRAAMSAQQNGNLTMAKAHFEKALSLQPGNPQLLNSLGMIALANGNYLLAIEYFTKAIDLDQTSPVLPINLATAHRNVGDDEGERKALLSVLSIDQSNLTANLRLAELHERLGEKGDAMQRWSIVVGLAQSMPDRSPTVEAMMGDAEAHLLRYSDELSQVLQAGLKQARADSNQNDLRRFDVCMDAALGRRRIYANDCAGLHFPFLPAEEFFDRSHFPWLADIEDKTDAITSEFLHLWRKPENFQPYVTMEDGTPQNKWSKLDDSWDWSAFFLWRHGVRNDSACEQCPATARAIEALPICHISGRSPTVFFSILKPNTHLPAHTGVTNVRSIVHLPLVIPAGCGFRVGGETRQWKTGNALVFDDTIDHEAWNDSDEPRAILIFDVWNPYLTDNEAKLLQKFFEVSVSSSFGNSKLID